MTKSLLIKDTTLGNVKRVVILLFTFLTFNFVSAQDRMLPAQTPLSGSSRGYETSLFDYFVIEESDNFAFIVKPSFSGESCLTYDKRTNILKLKRATRNIWYAQEWGNNKNRRKKKVPSQEFLLVISDRLATSLHAMFKSIVLTSTYLENRADGLDGVTYNFILQYGKVAECWSPSEDSNCGKAVSLVEELCDAVENSDSEKAEKLISEVVGVTDIFRQFYPEDFKEKNY